MAEFIDMTGIKCGRLLVESRGPNHGTRASWNCICECGNRVNVDGKKLRTGHTQSCGCFRADVSAVETGKKNKLGLDALSLHLEERKIRLVSPYLGSLKPLTVGCECGHEWTVARASSVLYTNGCPVCSKRENGFIGSEYLYKNPHLSDAQTNLYILRLTGNGECFYKVGITRQRLSERFRKIPYEIEPLRILTGGLEKMFELEKSLKRTNKATTYRPKIKFNGHAECFHSLNLDLIEDFDLAR